jgi:hypothetical protein
MNFINDLIDQNYKSRISVITSVNNSPFSSIKFKGVNIFRLGLIVASPFLRYFFYFIFNLFGTIILLLKRPDFIFVFESFSIFPAYIYSIFFKKAKVHIHFHEYISLPEKTAASLYMKLLFHFERILIFANTCSHTNEDRKSLYLADYPLLRPNAVYVFPNLPPRSWWLEFGRWKKCSISKKIKLVHFGVLSAETMFLEEILVWVSSNANELELTFFSQEITKSAKDLFVKYHSPSIILKNPVDYFNIPKILINFNIGLVLYKGHNPNYLFNIPNKVFEYISCGVKVVSCGNLFTLKKTFQHDILFLDINNLCSRSLIDLRHHLSLPSFYSFENTPKLSSLVN